MTQDVVDRTKQINEKTLWVTILHCPEGNCKSKCSIFCEQHYHWQALVTAQKYLVFQRWKPDNFPDYVQTMSVCQELSQKDFFFKSHKRFHSSFPEFPFLASLLCKGCCTLSPSIFNMWWSHHLQHQESGRFLFFFHDDIIFISRYNPGSPRLFFLHHVEIAWQATRKNIHSSLLLYQTVGAAIFHLS